MGRVLASILLRIGGSESVANSECLCAQLNPELLQSSFVLIPERLQLPLLLLQCR